MSNEINQCLVNPADKMLTTASSSQIESCVSSDNLHNDPSQDECTDDADESKHDTSAIARDDLTFFRIESNKYKSHLEKSEIVKLELLNRCNQLEIESRNYEKDKADMDKIIKENMFLKSKIAKMDNAYANQLSLMADTILKMEAMSRKKDLKHKKRVETLANQLRNMKTSGKRVLKRSKNVEDDEDNKESLESSQAKRIAELETQLEESKIALSAFKSCNTYISDMVRRDEEELRGELAKSTRDTEKFMSELETLELDMTSDLKHLEKELLQSS